MSKIGILSKHIVLTSENSVDHRYPVAGLILISDELIDSIILFKTDQEYSNAFQQYSDYELFDYTDLYISPGIIDINVRKEWEDLSILTKSAIQGGVTLMAVESNYYQNFQSKSEIYCDLAHITVINDLTDFNNIPQNSSALKCYLFPPCQQVKSVANLQNVMNQAMKTNLPLFIDATLPDPRMLYMASPLRLENIEERKDSDPNSSGLFAAAFPESMNSSGDSSDENQSEDDVPPTRSTSLQAGDIKKINFSAVLDDDLPSPKNKLKCTVIIPEARETEESSPLKISPLRKELELGKARPSKKKNSLNDIYNDLDNRIKACQQNIEDLCLAEKSTYSYSGSTSFASLELSNLPRISSAPGPNEKSSESKSSEPGSASLPNKPISKRAPFRPSPILIKPEVRPDSSRDYKYHLANYPEHWEVSGVEKIMEFLSVPSKVHFQNISSASALNRVRQIKNKFKKVTCEIPACHLYFTSASVKIGDTRFKNTPPVRNQGNCNLLWDLLKMKGIDVISSQHASIDPANKLTGNFQQVLNGISSIGCSLQSVWSVLNLPVSTFEQLEHYIVRLAKWFSLHPARVLNIEDKRGSIAKGKFADLIIWDPREKFIVDREYAYAKTSPFIGEELLGSVKKVFIRGKLVSSPIGIEVVPNLLINN